MILDKYNQIEKIIYQAKGKSNQQVTVDIYSENNSLSMV
jgi:hypothetical protein